MSPNQSKPVECGENECQKLLNQVAADNGGYDAFFEDIIGDFGEGVGEFWWDGENTGPTQDVLVFREEGAEVQTAPVTEEDVGEAMNECWTGESAGAPQDALSFDEGQNVPTTDIAMSNITSYVPFLNDGQPKPLPEGIKNSGRVPLLGQPARVRPTDFDTYRPIRMPPRRVFPGLPDDAPPEPIDSFRNAHPELYPELDPSADDGDGRSGPSGSFLEEFLQDKKIETDPGSVQDVSQEQQEQTEPYGRTSSGYDFYDFANTQNSYDSLGETPHDQTA